MDSATRIADQSWPSIDFGIDLDLSGSAYVFESGNNRGNFGPYATGDKFQVAIVGGVVKYKKNGTVFYTSSVTPAYPLVVDTALHANGSTLSNVVVSFAVGGPAKVQWLVPDHLGTPRIILDQTGSSCERQAPRLSPLRRTSSPKYLHLQKPDTVKRGSGRREGGSAQKWNAVP